MSFRQTGGETVDACLSNEQDEPYVYKRGVKAAAEVAREDGATVPTAETREDGDAS